MILSNLQPAKGSVHKSKALGRGRGSGKGGTSTKGGKGQKARKGAPIRRGFEGGQTPLMRRMPKVGFSNQPFARSVSVLNLHQLTRFAGQEVTPENLLDKGLVRSGSYVKVLAQGEAPKGLKLKTHLISAKARQAIEAAGGQVEILAI